MFFGIWRRRQPEVLKHWYVPLFDFTTSTAEFYDAIEQDLAAREVGGMEISRLDYAEGGVFSADREYLRMRRERLVFDICSAPFGTSWFFSVRFSEIQLQLMLWEVIVLLTAFAGVVWFYCALFGTVLGGVLCAASALSLGLLMRNTVRLGFQDLDAALLQIPIVGAFYEIFLRADTYYRDDTRLMYITIVDAIVRAKIEEYTKAQGVDQVTYMDAEPRSHPGILRMIGDLLRFGLR